MRVLFQPDDNLAFERIINTPKRGVGKGTLEQLHSTAREMNVSLYRALEAMVGVAGKDTERGQQTEPALSGVPYEMQQAFHGNNTNIAKLKGKTGEVLSRFMADLERWRKLLESMTLSELTETLIEESGYREMWMAEKSPDAAGRVENLRELVRALTEFETLTDFIEHVSLVAELADGKVGDMISLMTLHSAKGLEFDAVFLPGWEEGLFPHQRALDETGGKGLEEERRLAYVGITRARKKLYISHASNRRMYNQWQSSLPSRFLSELPAEHVDNLGGGNYGSRGSFADMRREMEAVFKGQGAGKNNYSPLEGESKSKSFNSKRFGEGTVYPSPQPSSSRGEGVTRLSSSSTANHQPSTSSFQSGTRVFHPKFGFGTVLQVEGKHLTVSFDEGGRKKVLSSFVARKGA